MNYTIDEVLQFTAENDVKFIRLAFCDVFGRLKNTAIMASELPHAFEDGISFDAAKIHGFESAAQGELMLKPIASTLTVLPWRPLQGRVARLFCDIITPDGTPFLLDSRRLLREQVDAARAAGYTCSIGSECEFYLFTLDESGNVTDTPLDKGGYLDIAPGDKGENVRREICLTLEEMDIPPNGSHHERGPGQNKIDLKCCPALSAADNLVTLESVADVVASRSGLAASFAPLPIPGECGNGLCVNLTLRNENGNIFDPPRCGEADAFAAGILKYLPEFMLFLNPLNSSYSRPGKFFVPENIGWSELALAALVRLPETAKGQGRIELHSADPSCNPYVAFALLIAAGIRGISEKLTLPAADTPYRGLPDTVARAATFAKDSSFVKSILPAGFIDTYISR